MTIYCIAKGKGGCSIVCTFTTYILHLWVYYAKVVWIRRDVQLARYTARRSIGYPERISSVRGYGKAIACLPAACCWGKGSRWSGCSLIVQQLTCKWCS